MKVLNFKLLPILIILNGSNVWSQENNLWDNTTLFGWPEFCNPVEINSTLDGMKQPAIFLKASGSVPRPLVVSLHTWSGDYRQKDTLVWTCYLRNYNYIHPDFRGPNNNPLACGSRFVLQDIEDAISFAIINGNVDTNQIHVIGVSGGGYAALLSYMNTKHPVKTFSAWAPISDLQRWYLESEGRGNKYALDIARSTVEGMDFNNDHYYLGVEEAIRRSPYYMETPVKRRSDSKLFIYTGIHDGYTGSVPITHSLLFFNKLVGDYNQGDNIYAIPDDDILELVTSRNFPGENKRMIGGRIIHYERTFSDLVKLVVFEGGHEMLPEVSLDHIESGHYLVIGDSNGAAEGGWVSLLEQFRFEDHICNISIPGNTIGFDNLGRKELNTLRNIQSYLDKAEAELGYINGIIFMLGTNDCKSVFRDSLKMVPDNLETLILSVKASSIYKVYQPRIMIVSPPPFGKDEYMNPKYHGGADRVAWLQLKFKEIAQKHECDFIDVYPKLLPGWDEWSLDGIHMAPEGHEVVARIISLQLD